MSKLDAEHDSLHGETAAKRQAITELLFFASVGDLYRCRKISTAWGLQASTMIFHVSKHVFMPQASPFELTLVHSFPNVVNGPQNSRL